MLPVKKVKVARTHSDALMVICACCIRKGGTMRPVSATVAELLQRFRDSGYDKDSGDFPVVICDSCRVAITKLGKVKI